MKRIPGLLTAMLFSIMICNSCSKNNDSNDPIVPPIVNPVVNDSSYADRIYIIDSTASGQDTSQVEMFTYDNLKRVTAIIDSVLNPAELFALKQFEYSGNDSLPFKSTLYIYDGTNRDTIITYHYFDNAGKLVKDSAININKSTAPAYYQVRQELINISYSTGMMYGFTRDSTMFVNNIPSTNPAIIITDTATLDANGNMIHSIRHRNGTVSTSTNSFDNQPHPFKRLNIFMCQTRNIFQSTYFDPSQPNTNNITHVLETRTGSSPYSYDFGLLNSYYSNGWLKTTAHPESAGSPDYEKYFFFYKTL